jgi:hypothetical protein
MASQLRRDRRPEAQVSEDVVLEIDGGAISKTAMQTSIRWVTSVLPRIGSCWRLMRRTTSLVCSHLPQPGQSSLSTQLCQRPVRRASRESQQEYLCQSLASLMVGLRSGRATVTKFMDSRVKSASGGRCHVCMSPIGPRADIASQRLVVAKLGNVVRGVPATEDDVWPRRPNNLRPSERRYHVSWSRSALASLRTGVSKPSVNQL